jgi:uncharacterized membrane protein YeaQ/YmgE (transglycosylase-associated protein family)
MILIDNPQLENKPENGIMSIRFSVEDRNIYADITESYFFTNFKEEFMGLLSWILVGLVAGWLADMVMKGRGHGVLFNIILGIVGALVGGFLASELFNVGDPLSGFNITSLLVAFLGAVVTILIVRALPGRSPV